jgi:outer membrane protein assembly factor BamB
VACADGRHQLITARRRGLVYVGSWNHKIYALDLETGKVRWSYDTGEEIDSSAAYADGIVYIGGNNGHIYALDASTGKPRWRASSFSRFGRREYFYATPTVAYGRVYIGNTDRTLYAFGAKTGTCSGRGTPERTSTPPRPSGGDASTSARTTATSAPSMRQPEIPPGAGLRPRRCTALQP